MDAGPKTVGYLFTRNQLPRSLEQHFQDLKRLLLQLDPQSASTQFPRFKIDFENPKPNDLCRILVHTYSTETTFKILLVEVLTSSQTLNLLLTARVTASLVFVY